ncbi:Aspartyl-tRNA(Asn) amidotransferase subunit C [Candidatus Syntrophocurvum alkaliphilum]|uniref:Aspartyl/glutamyl-tRNA(Asn/Gln) amidotransferase subunit C n=1 Tax=Candidatus Syntrophocurvum alkaliphilum TaxID=2293317 RepID=A0A6I6DE08_9FIRM|nr:Asp-tRNA(Asn)/Glu-tRNA(Gln) amidotransferase subunit GatC [Candidatus Syntrophocurvum alkaliphilum]QGT98828.1 Aspartyl-tRNA(Asn) amidotransferase subunit C [Candidatus Syntrophocurvum alkaliphilum]
MALTIEQIEHLALLVRLNLTENEKQDFANQLSSILNYVEKLNEISTDDVEPLTHILPVSNIFREDEVRPGTPREELLANAPLVEEGCFKVPKIL